MNKFRKRFTKSTQIQDEVPPPRPHLTWGQKHLILDSCARRRGDKQLKLQLHLCSWSHSCCLPPHHLCLPSTLMLSLPSSPLRLCCSGGNSGLALEPCQSCCYCCWAGAGENTCFMPPYGMQPEPCRSQIKGKHHGSRCRVWGGRGQAVGGAR